MISYTHISSPIGELRLRASEHGLLAVDHVCQQVQTDKNWVKNEDHSILKNAAQELAEYFLRKRHEFSIPLAPEGTPFQQEVWKALQTIPYGQTCTYSEIAQIIRKPKAVRAAGAANGKNPLSIFVPCHRVIGKNGKLTGYAGGIKIKQFLLDLEKTVYTESNDA
ncbi:MAG: methylated-DNA--[protein]-cysteine S-methyltransferase [Akkermansiaceae bacterium]